MIEPIELIKRWDNAERVLASMPEHERRHHWNMATWGERTQCGTVACAAGQCGMDPWFREHGFKLDFDGHGQAKISDVPTFFGMEGTARIFYNSKRRSVETVLEEVHAYIAEMQITTELLNGRSDLPKIGEEWPEQGGIFAGARVGIKGRPHYYLVVGPEHKGELDWGASTQWAEGLSIAGCRNFTLVKRREGHALFDRVPRLFQNGCYWLREQLADFSSYAWGQSFRNGYQGHWLKDGKLRARAVRRIAIQ